MTVTKPECVCGSHREDFAFTSAGEGTGLARCDRGTCRELLARFRGHIDHTSVPCCKHTNPIEDMIDLQWRP